MQRHYPSPGGVKRSIGAERDTPRMNEKHPKVKRDKWADREADKDRDEDDPKHPKPPTGSVGPGGSALDHLRDEAMESDPPEDRG
jgi:hypothetical protein